MSAQHLHQSTLNFQPHRREQMSSISTNSISLPLDVFPEIGRLIVNNSDAIAFARINRQIYNEMRPNLMAREHTVLENRLTSSQLSLTIIQSRLPGDQTIIVREKPGFLAKLLTSVFGTPTIVTTARDALKEREATIKNLKAEIAKIQTRLRTLTERLAQRPE